MGMRGLFVGINTYSERPLKGCVNDVTAVRELLKTHHGAAADQLRLISDGSATRQAIIDNLRWLAEPLNDGQPEVRIFHYAGHGLPQPDQNGDEPDGADECLAPIDYLSAGVLTDDHLAELYQGFLGTTRLILLMDCCHSGTISKDPFADIRYRTLTPANEVYAEIKAKKAAYQQNQVAAVSQQILDLQQRNSDPAEIAKFAGELLGSLQKQRFGQRPQHENLVLLAACKAEQVAADANFGGTYHGAMSFFLNTILSAQPQISYAELGEQLRTSLYANKFHQIPQLECPNDLLNQAFLA